MANEDAPKPFTGMSDAQIEAVVQMSIWDRVTKVYKGMTPAERQTATKWLSEWTARRSNNEIAGAVGDAAASVGESAATGVAGAFPTVDWPRLGVTVGVFILGVVLVILGIAILSKGAVTGVASSVVKGVIK